MILLKIRCDLPLRVLASLSPSKETLRAAGVAGSLMNTGLSTRSEKAGSIFYNAASITSKKKGVTSLHGSQLTQSLQRSIHQGKI